MIPKIIHYCWFSGDKFPYLVKQCIKSWRKILPDYEFKLWDSNSCDFNSVQYIKEAYENKQWAFVSDYIRLYALYNYGGIYLDSDVLVKQRFDEWHNLRFFTGIETRNPEHSNFWIEAAILGSEHKNPLIKEAMQCYENKHFIKPDGTFDKTLAPDIITECFIKHYGWQKKEGTIRYQDGTVVFGSDLITSSQYPITPTLKLYHCNNCSWIPTEDWRSPLYKYCRKHDLMRYYHIFEKLMVKIKRNKKT